MVKIKLTKIQEAFLDAIDIEIDETDHHNTTRSFECSSFEWKTAIGVQKKGLVKVLGDRDSQTGTFEVVLTQAGIDYLAELNKKNEIVLNTKLKRSVVENE